jgi:lysine 2,3-aminomutase
VTARPAIGRALVGAARRPVDLLERGLVGPDEVEALEAVTERYAMLASDYYLSLVDPNDPDDPIRLQAVPDARELVVAAGERADPIGDRAHGVADLLVHRYPDRALLFPTLRCPMFCRYCFRKVTLNEDTIRLRTALPKALAYLRAHPEIREVILSGGDPLMLSDSTLSGLLTALRTVPSVEHLRIHTRMPVTLPMRVDGALATLLGRHRPLVLVTHFNHPRELTSQAEDAVRALVDAGVLVLNQAVLLKGVNADTDTLAALFGGLLRWQVRPYYLHHLDLTVGTSHFRVSLDEGLHIVRRLRGRISGLANPTYVVEIPGGGGKVPVDSGWVVREGPGVWRMLGPLGGEWRYVDPAVHPEGVAGTPPGATRLETE